MTCPIELGFWSRIESRIVAILVVIFMSCLSSPASSSAAEDACDGTLRWIQGHLYLANGTPSVRLHDTKSGGTYGIMDVENAEYPEQPNLPADLMDVLSWDVKIHGKFLFCIMVKAEHFFDMGFVIKWDGHVVR